MREYSIITVSKFKLTGVLVEDEVDGLVDEVLPLGVVDDTGGALLVLLHVDALVHRPGVLLVLLGLLRVNCPGPEERRVSERVNKDGW